MWRYLHLFFLSLLVSLGLVACGGGSDDNSTDTGTNAPVIVTQPQSATMASGGSVTLSVSATGSGTLSYQWWRDGSAISGATASTYTASVAGSYTVVVSNAYGSVTSSAAVVTVSDTTTSGSWNISTGAYAPDLADTSGYLPLSIALDTLSVSSSASRLSVSNTSASVVTVAVDGTAAITLTRDDYGLTVRNTGSANIDYQLSGTGSTPLTVYSASDYKLSLSNASITSSDGPALNLQSKQTAFIALSGSNALSGPSTYSSRTTDDGDSMDLKAALFAEGPLVISGSGALSVNAAAKHALASDAHVRLLGGSIALNASAKDGLRANHAFVMDGGALTITTPAGKGIKVEGKESSTQPLGFIAINDGTLTITSYDKAITASWEAEDGDTSTTADDPDPRVTINGGTITATTTGTPYETSTDSLSPEGIESKTVLTINGGTITVNATDDALNAGTQIVINGGKTYAASSQADGLDSNGTITMTGGVLVASGAAAPEAGIENDSSTFTLTGGTLVAIGGSNDVPTASVSTQNAVVAGSVSAGLWTLRDASGNAVFAYQVPRAATTMLLSAPAIATGSSYTVVTGGSIASVSETFNGLYLNPTTHSGGTESSSVTISSRVTYLSGAGAGTGGGGMPTR